MYGSTFPRSMLLAPMVRQILFFFFFFFSWFVLGFPALFQFLQTLMSRSLRIPTEIYWLWTDPYRYGAVALYNICNEDNAEMFDTGGGHTIPRAGRIMQELANSVRDMIPLAYEEYEAKYGSNWWPSFFFFFSWFDFRDFVVECVIIVGQYYIEVLIRIERAPSRRITLPYITIHCSAAETESYFARSISCILYKPHVVQQSIDSVSAHAWAHFNRIWYATKKLLLSSVCVIVAIFDAGDRFIFSYF